MSYEKMSSSCYRMHKIRGTRGWRRSYAVYCLDKHTNTRIDITKIEQPRLTLQRKTLVCQLCYQPMLIKAGLVRQAHFAHQATICTTDYEYHPERPEHREAKAFLVEHLRQSFEVYTHAELEYEVPIPGVKRVVDVLATFPMGWRVAHEVQLASITREELQQRTDDYERAGIDVFWWLGKSANTPANRLCCEVTLTRFWRVGEEKFGTIESGGFNGQISTNLYKRIQAASGSVV